MLQGASAIFNGGESTSSRAAIAATDGEFSVKFGARFGDRSAARFTVPCEAPALGQTHPHLRRSNHNSMLERLSSP